MISWSTRVSSAAAVSAIVALAGTGIASAADETPTSALSVDQCVAALQYDPAHLLNHNAPGVENLPPTTTSLADGTYTVVTRQKKTIDNPHKDFSSAGLNAADIYPGAIVKVDSSLSDNRPTILPVDRDGKKLTISADLPGGYDSYQEITSPHAASVNHAVAGILESWNEKAAPKYGTQAARVVFNESLAHSKYQVEAAFGAAFTVKLANIGIDFNAVAKGEKQVYIASLQQVFYTVNANSPHHPSDFVNDSSANVVCGDKTVPGYISSVNYGRQIYVVAQTSSTDLDFKAAISAAVKDQKGQLSPHFSRLLENSDIKAIVLGGNAADEIKVTSGNVETIRKVINEGATYSRLNPAVPISYTVKFLKDNSVATARSVAEYYDTKVQTFKQGRLVINHKGGYVAQYYIAWDEVTGIDENGKAIIERREWDQNWKGRTAGASDLIVLPANARNITVRLREATGLAWNYWRTVVDERNLPMVPERVITIWGTTLNPKASNVVTE